MKARLACALLLVGCAEGAAPVVPQQTPVAHRNLQALRAEHTQLLKQLADAPASQVDRCSSTAGDCLIQVAEGRGRLVRSMRLNDCSQAADFASKSSCMTGQLEGADQTQALGDYLSLENWCFAQLTACTTAKAGEARQATLEARFAARKQEIEAGAETRAARNAVLLTHARVEYLRATLPPDLTVCEPAATFETCNARVEADQHTLEERLRRDDYDAVATKSNYLALEAAANDCARPELECLADALKPYGVVPESKKIIDRNFDLLAKRQALLAQTSAATGARCISTSQQEQQASIVSAYVAYAHEPVLFFRSQLDKAFLTLHQAQLSCLAAGPKIAPAKQTVAATR